MEKQFSSPSTEYIECPFSYRVFNSKTFMIKTYCFVRLINVNNYFTLVDGIKIVCCLLFSLMFHVMCNVNLCSGHVTRNRGETVLTFHLHLVCAKKIKLATPTSDIHLTTTATTTTTTLDIYLEKWFRIFFEF